jgi:hypothetical protein
MVTYNTNVNIGIERQLDAENLCPVCGFEMKDPPRNYNVCPSCGTEFGVHDQNATIEELRAAWIATGQKWWSNTEQEPAGWNPFRQLARLGLASGPIVSRSAVVLVTSTTSSAPPIQPPTSSWPGSVDAAWGRSADRLHS